MKRIWIVLGLLVAFESWQTSVSAKTEDNLKVGDTGFVAYEGSQNWPTADKSELIKDYSIPIYLGIPNKNYKVLGRVIDKRSEGLGVVGRAFDEGLGKESYRMRDVANQARLNGANAVVVTDNENVLKTFNLTPKQIEDSAPLFNHKHKIVLAVKID